MTRRRPSSSPRTKPPEQRRDELTSAAQRLFLAQGVAATTVEQITGDAGVAKGTLYLYFTSKDDILAALEERFARELLAGIEAALAAHPDADWKGKLATWARAGIDGYLDAIRLHDLLMYSARPPRRQGMDDNIVIDHLAHLLQAGSAAGAWSPDDQRFTAVFLFCGLRGIVDDAAAREPRVNRRRLAQRLETICFRAVGLRAAAD
jgi:AcrR family transcriptional regulator